MSKYSKEPRIPPQRGGSIKYLLLIFVLAFSSYAKADDVLILGDSHTQAFGLFLSSDISNHSITVVARPGWTSRSFLNRPDVIPATVDTVVILLGGNNLITSEAQYAEGVGALVSELRARGARKLYWVSPLYASNPEVNSRHRMTSDFQSRVVRRLDIPWCDVYTRTQDELRSYHFRDGVHYTYPSYRRITRNILLPFLSDL